MLRRTVVVARAAAREVAVAPSTWALLVPLVLQVGAAAVALLTWLFSDSSPPVPAAQVWVLAAVGRDWAVEEGDW
jgi:hypothetical protein